MFMHHVYNTATVAALLFVSCAHNATEATTTTESATESAEVQTQAVEDTSTNVPDFLNNTTDTTITVPDAPMPRPRDLVCGIPDDGMGGSPVDKLGTPCTKKFPNGCVSDGVWDCAPNSPGLACNALPKAPAPFELCNGIDDDCNGKTDEDWPELHKPCSVFELSCELTGTWECMQDGYDDYCTAEDKFAKANNGCD